MGQKRAWLLRFGATSAALFLLAGCGGAPPVPPTATPVEEVHEAGDADEHMEAEDMHVDEHSPGEHMEGDHGVPDEAAAIQNPLEATQESIALGGELYQQSCAVCHGEDGEGDGPAAEPLDPKPSDLHEDHVQANSDGALFYIISHGRPETAMPAWEDVLDEEQRWHLVNYLRTFGPD